MLLERNYSAVALYYGVAKVTVTTCSDHQAGARVPRSATPCFALIATFVQCITVDTFC